VKFLPTQRAIDAAQNGQTLGRGVDFALTMLVFLGVGALVDHWLGTWPLVAIVLVVLSVVGQFIKMYYEYGATMDQLQAERAAARAAQPKMTAPSPEQAA